MKVIIAGPRDLVPHEYEILKAMIVASFGVTEVVTGGAKGIDSCAMGVAVAYSLRTKLFEADWKQHGKAAGPIRNREMAEYADALLVIKRRDTVTPGTSNMTQQAMKCGLPVFVYEVEGTYRKGAS